MAFTGLTLHSLSPRLRSLHPWTRPWPPHWIFKPWLALQPRLQTPRLLILPKVLKLWTWKRLPRPWHPRLRTLLWPRRPSPLPSPCRRAHRCRRTGARATWGRPWTSQNPGRERRPKGLHCWSWWDPFSGAVSLGCTESRLCPRPGALWSNSAIGPQDSRVTSPSVTGTFGGCGWGM